MNASKQQENIFPVGTRIRFTKTLTCAATGDHPDFLYAQAGDEGEITGHGTKEGYWAKTSYNPPFGVSRDEFEPIELSTQQESEQPFSVGDNVQYMGVSSRGSSISFSTKEGKIVIISKPKGINALIQKRNGRKEWVKTKDLRRIGQPSPVEDVFKAIVKAHEPE